MTECPRCRSESCSTEAPFGCISLFAEWVATTNPRSVRHFRVLRDLHVWLGQSCYLCGARPVEAIDHVHPRARGGRESLDNLGGVCGPCNSKKSDRLNHIGPEATDRLEQQQRVIRKAFAEVEGDFDLLVGAAVATAIGDLDAGTGARVTVELLPEDAWTEDDEDEDAYIRVADAADSILGWLDSVREARARQDAEPGVSPAIPATESREQLAETDRHLFDSAMSRLLALGVLDADAFAEWDSDEASGVKPSMPDLSDEALSDALAFFQRLGRQAQEAE